MRYPHLEDITDPAPELRRELLDAVLPAITTAQKEYRTLACGSPCKTEEYISVLRGLAVEVVNIVSADELANGHHSFAAFRERIGPNGGALELALRFVHYVYKDVTGGRMPWIWHKAIKDHLQEDTIAAQELAWWQRRASEQRAGDTGDPGQETPYQATWEDVTITFLSDERVEIKTNKAIETRNYAEMGFEDRRNGKPRRAWSALLLLAHNKGEIEPDRLARDWPNLEKRVEEIRDALRRVTGVQDDPIPWTPGSGYRTRFTIRCAPSVRS